MVKKNLNERVVCADGFSISVQANEMAYSEPRNNDGPYTYVELGYPSEPDELIMSYAENSRDPRETVYPYVPVSTVSLLIAKHGGMVSGTVPYGVPRLQGKKPKE